MIFLISRSRNLRYSYYTTKSNILQEHTDEFTDFFTEIFRECLLFTPFQESDGSFFTGRHVICVLIPVLLNEENARGDDRHQKKKRQ